jgi:hypothetical protein
MANLTAYRFRIVTSDSVGAYTTATPLPRLMR